MTDEQQAIYTTVRAVLERNGVYMTPRGPVGPEDIEKRVLGGLTREHAIDDLALVAARKEAP